MYCVFTRMPGESYHRWFRSLMCSCDVFWALINSPLFISWWILAHAYKSWMSYKSWYMLRDNLLDLFNFCHWHSSGTHNVFWHERFCVSEMWIRLVIWWIVFRSDENNVTEWEINIMLFTCLLSIFFHLLFRFCFWCHFFFPSVGSCFGFHASWGQCCCVSLSVLLFVNTLLTWSCADDGTFKPNQPTNQPTNQPANERTKGTNEPTNQLTN